MATHIYNDGGIECTVVERFEEDGIVVIEDDEGEQHHITDEQLENEYTKLENNNE